MGSFLASSSLLAPSDIWRFVLAYLALVMAPGYALAVVARPRAGWLERLALAIPCAYALVAISGLGTALLRLPFTLLAYGILALPITAAGGRALWRQRGERTADLGRWQLVPLGVAVVQMCVIVLVFGPYVVPPGGDAVMHIYWTNLLAHTHAFPLALLSSHASATDGGFYPPVFHALTTLILGVAPMAAYHAVFYSMVSTTVLLPLALFTYVRVATGSARVAALAALASLAFDPFPFYVPTQGMYTLTVSQLFVPALAITLRDGLRGDRRAIVLAALLGVGLFYTHPTELITVALLALAIVPGQLRTACSWLHAARYSAVIAAIWGVAALPALAAVHRTMAQGAQTEIQSSHYFVAAPQAHLGTALDAYLQGVYGRNVSYVLLALCLIGMAWCLAQRRWLGLVVTQVILTGISLDAASYDLLHRFYVLSFPWALPERLEATHYWFALPLAAVGGSTVLAGIGRLVRAKSLLFAGLVVSPLVLCGLLLPLSVTTGRIAAFTRAHVVMAVPDLGAVGWLSRHAAAGSVVVNDSNLTPRVIYDAPTDAGLWMPDMGGPQPLFWRGETGPGSLADRNYLLEHISDSPLPPRASRFITQHHVRYVFYGAGLRITAQRHLNLVRLLADPRIHLVYASAVCHATQNSSPTHCPATASYVFALDGQA